MMKETKAPVETSIEGNLGIGEVLQRIKTELIETDRERQSQGEQALFWVDDVSVELKFAVSRVSGDSLKFDLKVLGYNDKEDYTTERCHTIRINLKTVSETGIEGPLGSLATKKPKKIL